MKRKVASAGRQRVGFGVTAFLRNLFPSDADGGAISVFSEESGNTRGGVEENANRGNRRPFRTLSYIIGRGGK